MNVGRWAFGTRTSALPPLIHHRPSEPGPRRLPSSPFGSGAWADPDLRRPSPLVRELGTRNPEPDAPPPTPVHHALGPRTSDLTCLSDRRLSELGTRNPDPRTHHPTPRVQGRNPEPGTRNPEPGRHHRRDAGSRTVGIWPRPRAPSPEVGTRMLHLARSHPARRAASEISLVRTLHRQQGPPPPPSPFPKRALGLRKSDPRTFMYLGRLLTNFSLSELGTRISESGPNLTNLTQPYLI